MLNAGTHRMDGTKLKGAALGVRANDSRLTVIVLRDSVTFFTSRQVTVRSPYRQQVRLSTGVRLSFRLHGSLAGSLADSLVGGGVASASRVFMASRFSFALAAKSAMDGVPGRTSDLPVGAAIVPGNISASVGSSSDSFGGGSLAVNKSNSWLWSSVGPPLLSHRRRARSPPPGRN